MKHVYFIKPIGMQGPVKIGCSCAPDNRRRSLASWSPFPLEIVAEIAGNENLERRFHAMLESTFISREWFAWSPELAGVIDAITAGTFDASNLPAPKLLPRKSADLSYITPGWKYRRSVIARIDHARWKPGARGAKCDPVRALVSGINSYDEAQLSALRETVEPMVDALVASMREAAA
jgi:hypothetical protein